MRDSLLWEISKHGQIAFLGATMHLALPGCDAAIRRLNLPFEGAIASFYNETELQGLAQAQNLLTENGIDDLRSFLSPISYRKYRLHLLRITGLDLDSIAHLSPLFIQTIIQSELVKPIYPQSIDHILWQSAKSREIPCHGLESAEEQLEIYDQIPVEFQYRTLKSMLKNLSKCRRHIHRMADLYANEKIHSLYRVGKRDLGPIRQLMIRHRNDRMVGRIVDQMDRTEGVIYFTTGAAHFSGKWGILHGLSSQGYSLRPIIE